MSEAQAEYKEVAVVEDEKQVAVVGSQPVDLVQYAIGKGADLATIEKLLELKYRDEANEARKAFAKAMAEFRKEIIVIVKDKDNKQYGSKYSSKGNIINTASPYLGKHGLSHSFDIEQDGESITISCIVTHELGHSEKRSMTAPVDKSGQKNPIQQIKSTKTYLEIATFESVTGLASSEGSLDDDGNGAGPEIEKITDEQVASLCALADEVGADFDKFCKFFKVDDIENLPAGQYDRAIKMLEKKRNA